MRFQNPPAQLELGVRSVEGISGLLTARLYGFGVASLPFRVHLGEKVPWKAFLEKALALPGLPFWEGFLWRSWPLWNLTSKGPSSAPRWNVVFATATVLLNAFLGLILGLVLNNKALKLRNFYRALLIVSWALPGVITV